MKCLVENYEFRQHNVDLEFFHAGHHVFVQNVGLAWLVVEIGPDSRPVFSHLNFVKSEAIRVCVLKAEAFRKRELEEAHLKKSERQEVEAAHLRS
jgi:hypothetical protein